MTPICAYAIRRWFEIARDGRGHASALAFFNADYLAEKGVAFDDLSG